MLQPFDTFAPLLGVLGFVVILKLVLDLGAPPGSLPPGPPLDPIIGHARKISKDHSWVTFAEWGKTYGDVMTARVLGRTVIVLNTFAAARDLLDRKSGTFSDRPSMPLATLMGLGSTMPFLTYGSRLRKHRRMMHKHFGLQALSEEPFKSIQENHVRNFLRDLLNRPGGFLKDLHKLVAGMIVLMIYGHKVVSEDDPYTKLVDQASKMIISSGSPGATLIDFIPSLRHIPTWFPGTGLKKHALATSKFFREVIDRPYDEAKLKKATGKAPRSVVANLLDECDEVGAIDKEHEDDMKALSAVVYTAGEDTTKTVLATFFMMMTLHPEVVKKAQGDIDNAVGTARLPVLEDRSNLPYIDRIIKELYRINPPAPLGMPHMSTQEDRYRSWTIPNKTTVIANIWQMMRDEENFPDPETFLPERHAGKAAVNGQKIRMGEATDGQDDTTGENDPSAIVFGFGRRICPGQAFADTTIWLTIVNVLWAFDIRPCIDPVTGEENLPEVAYDVGMVSVPKPFKCSIIPRSAKHAELIKEHHA
ncbi:hypothetical protein M0805_002801 [Coniferiporia weirii]|nr:hypothetical protein M0805_002801 [Coniferiporia weirii]